MTDPARLDALASALWEAEQTRRPIPPLTDDVPGLTVDDAYEIQSRNVARKLDAGRLVLGRKVGLTSRAMQQMLGVNEPDYGVLTDDMFVEEGDAVSVATLCQPKIEAEIAFVMDRDLIGPGVTTTAALRAIGGAMPSLEIIDSRVAGWKIRLVDTIADNASSARLVLGGRITPLDHLDLRLLGLVVSRNGEVVETGAGAAVLGNPARCVAWLANKLAPFGVGLRAGDVVIPGCPHKAIDVTSGDSVRADFAHLGSVAVHFVA